jgi:Uma2 family endonuclease
MSWLEPRVSVEEFTRIPDDEHRYELVEGRVIRMSPPGSRHAVLTTRLAVLLFQHVEPRSLGAVMTSGGFWLAADPDTVREPDVAFVRQERIPDAGVPQSFWPGAPDLAVEIVSPGDRSAEINAKVRDYLAHGVRLVWIVDPGRKAVTAHRPGSRPVVFRADDVLDAGDVIPGFRCSVRQIFQ